MTDRPGLRRSRPTWIRILWAVTGIVVGAVAGFAVTLGIVVLEARFGFYIYAMHDLTEFRWDTLPILLGAGGGGVLGYRNPFKLLRALLRGTAAALIVVLPGFVLGRTIWGPGPGAWSGAIVLAAAALAIGTVVAFRLAMDDALRLPDWCVGAAIMLAVGIAVVIGLRDPEAVEAIAVEPEPLPPVSMVEQAIFVLGDGGTTVPDRSPILEAIRGDIERWSEALATDSAVSVVFPGDLVYPVGVRDRTHPDFPTDSTRLWNQIELVAGPSARSFRTLGLFQPGNHDWGNSNREIGFDRIRNLMEQLDMARADGLSVGLFPENGEPGPVVRDVRENVRFVLLDTHWYLRTRSADDRRAFLDRIEDAVTTAGDRYVILSAHHPFQSAGPHGAIVPGLHAWGVGYLLRRSGALVQDLNSPAYGSLLAGLRGIFERAPQPPLLFIGGHDHSLQVLEGQSPSDPSFVAVSGAGSKVSSIRALPGMHYGAGAPGYMMLLLTRDGGISLYVVAGAPELLTCNGQSRSAVAACVARGESSYDLVYGQLLARAPQGPPEDPVADRGGEDTSTQDPDPEGEVANLNPEDAPEPLEPAGYAWWTRRILPPDHVVAEDEDSILVPPPAVPARTLFFRPDSVSAPPGAAYAAGSLQRLVLGDLNRDLWDVPVRLPVVDLDTLGGGVEVVELSGGKQTLGFIMEATDGREFQFRSMVKILSPPETLEDTPVEPLLQDQLAAQFPFAALVVAELLLAVDVLVAPTRPVILPHSRSLGEYRPFFGGRMGWIEERANEGSENEPGFAGSRHVVSGGEIYDELAERPNVSIAVGSYLRARMVDFVVGDWDRHSDNLRWAEIQGDSGAVWQPVPRDRDWALSRTGGLANPLSGGLMPQYVGFGPEMPPVSRIAEAGYWIDRRILLGVPRHRFVEEAAVVRSRLTPEIIQRAVAALPPEFHAVEGEVLRNALSRRIEQLDSIAGEFHDVLNEEIHLYGHDGWIDTVEIAPGPGPNVTVRITSLRDLEEARQTWTIDPTLTRVIEAFLDADDALEVDPAVTMDVRRTDPSDLIPDEGGGRDARRPAG